ncbi:MAG: prephenate dehydrogenase/arogenate dehydrogenase family protein [Haloferacaceae archaeon]
MDLLVVGAGEMGRWVGDRLDAAAYADRDPSAAAAAAEATGAGTVPVDGDKRFEAVCLAVPISAAEAAVAAQAPRAERALVDVTGAMAAVVDAMREHAPDRERLSLHPLFAPENAPGNVAAVHDAAGPVTRAVRDALDAAGNDVFDTTPTEHDEAMRTVQAGAHAAVLAYALAADDVRPEFATPVSGRLDDLVATVTGGSPDVYREIQETFAGADRVADAARRVADAEGAAFDRLYREARTRGGRGAASPVGDRSADAETDPDAGSDPTADG